MTDDTSYPVNRWAEKLASRPFQSQKFHKNKFSLSCVILLKLILTLPFKLVFFTNIKISQYLYNLQKY